MAEELQQLLEKIQKEGVDKANAEAAAIVKTATDKAKAVEDAAAAKAKDLLAKAELDAEAYATRAKETIAQAARDTVKTIEDSVSKMLEKLLAQNVDAALSDPATVASMASEAVKALASDQPADVAANAKLAEALKAQFAASAQKGVTVVTDESTGAGFSVKLDGGRVEHAFTGPVVAEALARRLRSDLAALVK